MFRNLRYSLFRRKVGRLIINFAMYDYNASLIPTCNNRYLDFMRKVIRYKEKIINSVESFLRRFTNFRFDDIRRDGSIVFVTARFNDRRLDNVFEDFPLSPTVVPFIVCKVHNLHELKNK